MNILQIISKNDKYGAQRVFLDQVSVLHRMGNTVVVVVRGENGYVTDSVSAMGVPCYGIPMKNVKDILFLRRLVKLHEIEIIHTSLDRADHFGILLSLFTGIPVVSTMHVRRYHMGFRFANGVITSSRQQGRTLLQRKVKADRIHLIRPGIEGDRFVHLDVQKRDEWKRKLHTDNYSVVFNHIASLHEPKAHIVSLELIAECKQRGETPLLVILGGELRGNYYESLQTKIEERKLNNNVMFSEWTPDVPEIMSLCHFTLLPSVNEALGMVLLEGLAAGTPIMARKGEGGAEVIEEYGAGFLYDPDSGVGPLADDLLSLYRDAERYQTLSQTCRQIAAEEFSLARFGSRLMEVYRTILS